ncbi:SET domain-containing protein-lysine N-methyltransferase [Dactylosporangium sp. CS-047395]|uniref:SET domain-containing protein-lysine N-methyltransferase n=1 Tax=Dactylosporangium sp. CS-047395 TaxID=3239936 RepID=UPI003D91C015
MSGVRIGAGNLGGRGLWAERDFAAGEVVVAYELRELDAREYAALPAGEELFVHSYWGRRYLYPAPARYVNHADDPSCYQDFDRACDVARRPIAAGEAITIDAGQETARELATFLAAWNDDPARRPELVAADAVLWRDGVPHHGREAVLGRHRVHDPAWLVGTGRWEALCSATSGGRHVTMLLKVVAGNWQLVYQHLG